MEDRTAEEILGILTEAINDRAVQFRNLNERLKRCEEMCASLERNQEELMDIFAILYGQKKG